MIALNKQLYQLQAQVAEYAEEINDMKAERNNIKVHSFLPKRTYFLKLILALSTLYLTQCGPINFGLQVILQLTYQLAGQFAQCDE